MGEMGGWAKKNAFVWKVANLETGEETGEETGDRRKKKVHVEADLRGGIWGVWHVAGNTWRDKQTGKCESRLKKQ